MQGKVNRYKLRILGTALIVSMLFEMLADFIPWQRFGLEGIATDFSVLPFRYILGLLAGLLALIGARNEKKYYYPLLVGIIATFLASVVITYIEHFRAIDSLVDLNLFLHGVCILLFLELGTARRRWRKIVKSPPIVLDLRLEGKQGLFDRMVVAPHLEINGEILNAVDRFLANSTQSMPLSLCLHSTEPVSKHLQQVAREAFQMHYEDEEQKVRHTIESRYARCVWMIVIGIGVFRFLSYGSGSDTGSIVWEILGSFAAFSLWKVGDIFFESSESARELTNILIAKSAKIEFL